jgi:hypothetical protein
MVKKLTQKKVKKVKMVRSKKSKTSKIMRGGEVSKEDLKMNINEMIELLENFKIFFERYNSEDIKKNEKKYIVCEKSFKPYKIYETAEKGIQILKSLLNNNELNNIDFYNYEYAVKNFNMIISSMDIYFMIILNDVNNALNNDIIKKDAAVINFTKIKLDFVNKFFNTNLSNTNA